MDTRTGDFERVVGHDPETVGLDQSVRFDDQKPAIRGSAGYPHDPVGLIVGFQRPTEELVNLHPLFYDGETVFEVVEHLALGRKVGAILAQSPLDVAGGEHGMWLVQSNVRICVDPHAADAFPAVDQDDLLITREVSAGDEQGVESGDAGSHDADVTALHPRRLLNWRTCSCHGSLLGTAQLFTPSGAARVV